MAKLSLQRMLPLAALTWMQVRGNELVPGAWTHVVAVHGTVQDKIFINGVLAASKDVGAPLHHTTHPLGIGWDPIDKGSYINGDMDDVQLYNTELI